jgi:hypothetical protein
MLMKLTPAYLKDNQSPYQASCPDVHHEGGWIEAVSGIADTVVRHYRKDWIQTLPLGHTITLQLLC